MGKRKVTILEAAAVGVAEIAWFIESKGLPATAKRFVDEAFSFFETLADEKVVYHPCRYGPWKVAGYRCVRFRKKYTVAYLEKENEVIICSFSSNKSLQ